MVANAIGRLDLDGNPFRQELNKIADEPDKKLNPAFKKVGQLIAGAFTVNAIKDFAMEALRTADEIDNLSKRMSIGTEATQALKVMTEEAGLQMGDMQAVLLKLESQTARASQGNKDLTAAFEQLGINMDEVAGMSIEDMLDRVSTAMHEGSGNADVMNAAVRIFGEDTAPKMRAVLEQIGEKGLPATIQGFKDLGLVLDGDVVKKLDAAEETVSRFWKQFNRNNTEAFADLITFIGDAFGESMGGAAELSDWVQKKVDAQNREQEELARKRQAQLEYEKQLMSEISALEAEQSAQLKSAQSDADKLTEARRREKEIVEQLSSIEGKSVEDYRDQLKLQNELHAVRATIADAEKKAAEERDKAAKEEQKQAEKLNSLKEKLAGIEYDRLDAADKLKVQQDQLIKMQERRNQLERDGLTETEDYLQLRIDIANAEDEITGLNEKQAKQQEQAKKAIVEQVAEIEKMRDLIGSMTDEEMQRFVKAIEDMTIRLAALPDVQALDWMEDIANFKLPSNITEGKARQLADAIVAFVNTLNRKLGALPALDFLKQLQPLSDFKLPSNITEGKARQVADAIATLVNGLKGLGGQAVDIEKLTKALSVIEALNKMNGKGGKWELEIVVPPGFQGLLPVGFDKTMVSIDASLKTLAGLKGIAWH